jgi:hypothetical protein
MNNITLFKIALAINEETLTDFSRNLGVNPASIYKVLNNELVSNRISGAIEDYIKKAEEKFSAYKHERLAELNRLSA